MLKAFELFQYFTNININGQKVLKSYHFIKFEIKIFKYD